jgi:hypothetical protein
MRTLHVSVLLCFTALPMDVLQASLHQTTGPLRSLPSPLSGPMEAQHGGPTSRGGNSWESWFGFFG